MYWLDSVMFNGEPVVHLRLKYLFPYVERFYICEQRYTHQGERKNELFFEKHKTWFEPYMSKITFLVDETKYTGNTWDCENGHRRYAIPFLQKDYYGKQYILSVCDVDEIPNASIVMNERDSLYVKCSKGAVYMKQKMFYYNLQWFVQSWDRAFFVNNRILDVYSDVQMFRNQQGPKSGEIECGWHLSYFFDKYGVQRKLKSFAHKEFNIDQLTNIDFLGKAIKEGNFLYSWNPKNVTKYTGTDFPSEFIEFNKHILLIQDF